MAPYVVLARKWRPAQFSDIVGQGNIVRTLMNAIRAERVHQAYLFTGSRGIGKTSIARIFAKAIRCPNASWNDQWLISCGECSSCKEIAGGSSVDVIEIDGASNNGVDAVREIRENAKFLPSSGSRKIYIIDEVHMLTTAAFNALLKTLEEPPPHVIFVFATTEPHKIPATILSRVQRFDFRRVTIAQIQARLAEVTQSEGISVELGALALIARAAEGSMRDALSLLDQVIAFSGTQITLQSVRDSIGLIEGQTLVGILEGIFTRKPLDALAHIERAYEQGHDLKILARSLIEFLHAAILAKLGSKSPANLELSDDEWQELKRLTEHRTLEEMELIFQALHYGVDWIARSPQPKIVLDVLIVKCATAEALVYAADSGGSSASSQGASSASGETAAMSTGASTLAGSGTKIVPASLAPEPNPASAIRAALSASPKAQKSAPNGEPNPSVPLGASIAPPTQNRDTPAQQVKAAPSRSDSVPPAQRFQGDLWEGFTQFVKQTRPLLASILEHGTCGMLPTQEGSDQTLEVNFKPEEAYFREQLQSRAYSEQVLTLAREFFGLQVRIRVEIKDTGESLAERKQRELKERELAAQNAVKNHPIITEAKALFGGELGPIELIDPKTGESHAIH